MTPRVLDHEKQLERENVILDSALSFIENDGIALLTMDKLIREVPYSKGTVYNHFTGKEDLLLALCNRSMSILSDLFQKVESFDGICREKVLAIHFAYMLYARLYPTQFMLVITAKSTNVTDKSSALRNDEHIQLEGKLLSPIMNLFQQALDAGELDAPSGMNLDQIAFAGWSLAFGTNALLLQDVDRCTCRSDLIVEREMFNNVNILLDGLRFTPLSGEYDWSPAIKRFKEEIFSQEVRQLNSRGITLAI